MKNTILTKDDIVDTVKEVLRIQNKKKDKRNKRLFIFGFTGGLLGVALIGLVTWHRLMHVPNNQD